MYSHMKHSMCQAWFHLCNYLGNLVISTRKTSVSKFRVKLYQRGTYNSSLVRMPVKFENVPYNSQNTFVEGISKQQNTHFHEPTYEKTKR